MWQAGDSILITSSNQADSHAETARITAVAVQPSNTSTISLQQPLRHSHQGSLLSHAGHTLDMRARAAVLSRNIVISGEDGGSPPYVATAGSTQTAAVAMSGVQMHGQVRP